MEISKFSKTQFHKIYFSKFFNVFKKNISNFIQRTVGIKKKCDDDDKIGLLRR